MEYYNQCVIKQGKIYVLHKCNYAKTKCGMTFHDCQQHVWNNLYHTTDSHPNGMQAIEDHAPAPVDMFVQKKFASFQYDFACPDCFPDGVSEEDDKYEL